MLKAALCRLQWAVGPHLALAGSTIRTPRAVRAGLPFTPQALAVHTNPRNRQQTCCSADEFPVWMVQKGLQVVCFGGLLFSTSGESVLKSVGGNQTSNEETTEEPLAIATVSLGCSRRVVVVRASWK